MDSSHIRIPSTPHHQGKECQYFLTKIEKVETECETNEIVGIVVGASGGGVVLGLILALCALRSLRRGRASAEIGGSKVGFTPIQ